MSDASSRSGSTRADAPLAGVRVLDCSRVLAGPYCTVLLSFLGAEVVKIEDFRGDEGRQWPPHRDGMGASFLALNANKKSIAVDLKAAAGAAIVRDLATTADELVENFKAGDMERFGLGYDDVAPLNPRLVYTSISAFGRRRPQGEGTPATRRSCRHTAGSWRSPATRAAAPCAAGRPSSISRRGRCPPSRR